MASIPMAQDIIRCDLCTKGTFTGITPAEVVCKTCNINLCKVCMAEHVSSQLSVKHDILGIRYRSPDFNFILPFCHIHPKLKCELNCRDCNVPVCSKCLAGPHKKHDFVEISKIFNSQKEIMEQDNEELKNFILPKYDKINAEYEDKISKVPRGYDNFKKEITKQGEEWHKILDVVIRKHLRKAEEMEAADVAILRRDQSEIRKVQKSAQDVFEANKSSLQSNDTDKVINYKSRNAELKKVPAKTELSPPSFSPCKISEELVGQMFGEIKPSIKTEIPCYSIKIHGSVSSSPVKQFIAQPKSAEIESGLDVPQIVCCVPDTEQVYVAGLHSSTINHLDNKGKLLNKIKTKSGNKYDINLSVMRDGRLVYSDGYDKSINIVNSNKIDTVIRLQGWYPLAVCCTSTNDLLVTMRFDDYNNKVVRYAGSKLIQEIQYDDQGEALYNYPGYIVENRNLDICVSEGRVLLMEGEREVDKGAAVVVVDKTGKLKFTYDGNHNNSIDSEFTPCGLATDSQCHILVTNYDGVHILNHDGSFLRCIDHCNLVRPIDLSISTDDVLYVLDGTKKVKVLRYLQ